MTRRLSIFYCILVASIFIATACYAEDVRSASPLDAKDVGKAQTSIGCLFTDAMRDALNTDFAFVGASEVKEASEPLPAGKVSSSDVAKFIAYPGDSLAVLELTGKAIRAALEKSVAIYPQPSIAFLQISGAKVTFDPDRSAGNRINSVLMNNRPIDENALYSIAVTNSMANGAVGYWRIWKPENVKTRKQNMTIAKAVEAMFKSTPNIDYTVPDRISAVSK